MNYSSFFIKALVIKQFTDYIDTARIRCYTDFNNNILSPFVPIIKNKNWNFFE